MTVSECNHHCQRGFSLFEVLIAVVILAVGLLGLAGLQLWGLRYNTESYSRSQATIVVNELIERMHINLAGMTAYNGLDSNGNCGAALAPSCEGAIANACTAAQMANYDLCEAFDQAEAVIRVTNITINCSAPCSATTPTFLATVNWVEDVNENTEPRSVAISFQP